ncbi:M17 family peptidase N-terminal domain-containing protein, partial [Pseudomonadota bacterium]
MKLHLDNTSLASIDTDCLVVGVCEGDSLSPAATAVDKATGGSIGRMIESGDIESGLGKTSLLHGLPGLGARRVLTVGFGKSEKLNLARFDRGCLAAGKALRDFRFTECHVSIHDVVFDGGGPASRLRQAALAIHRSNFLYTTTKSLKDDAPAPLTRASFQGGPEMEEALGQAGAFAAGY